MAIVTTYLKDGVADVKELVRLMVIDLTGTGVPSFGTASEHMKLIFPTSLDLTDSTNWDPNTLVILESTLAIDPFADPDVGTPTAGTVPGYDPWRIAFHISSWTGRSSVINTASSPTATPTWGDPTPDPVTVASLAVYLGTPSTLSVDSTGTTATIGWLSTNLQKLPYYAGFTNIGVSVKWKYKPTYVGKDLVEPVGNTGAQWTNTFDPTSSTIKYYETVPGLSSLQQPEKDLGPGSFYESPEKWDGPDVTDANQLFFNRYVTAGAKTGTKKFAGFAANSAYSQPISYQITLTDHGLFLGCWGPDPEENGKGFSWLLAQRPVDKKTGITRGINPATGLPYTGTETDGSGNTIPLGNRPLFCVNSVNGNFYKFVVREHDNPVPSSRKDATQNTPDSSAVINPYQQQSLTENGEYVITFLNNLNSSRFKYADELDMLGTVSSDVVGGGSQINVSVYSEEQKRGYHALWSSGSFGTKMRIMVVADIPTPNQPWA
jgi:hypothetical protein